MELSFHEIHGSNLKLDDRRIRATRFNKKSFCDAICFSNRPIATSEVIHLRITETMSGFSGHIRIGFTNTNPETYRQQNLPSFAIPNLTDKPGNWATPLNPEYGIANNEIFFSFDKNGDVHIGKDLKSEQIIKLKNVTETKGPLWALFDVYGTTCGIELMGVFLQHDEEIQGRKPKTECMPRKLDICNVSDIDLHFHDVHGTNLKLKKYKKQVSRLNRRSFCNAICFSSRPILLDESICLQITETDRGYSGNMRFGFTSKDPDIFREHGLPPYALPDMVNDNCSWATSLYNKHNKIGNLVSFYITENGEVYLSVNGTQYSKAVLSGLDISSSLWAMIDVYGGTSGVELVSSSPQNYKYVADEEVKFGSHASISREEFGQVSGRKLNTKYQGLEENVQCDVKTLKLEDISDQAPGRRGAKAKDSDVSKHSADRSDFKCGPCYSEENVVETEGFCEECNEHLCKTCLRFHNKLSATRNHRVILTKEMFKY